MPGTCQKHGEWGPQKKCPKCNRERRDAWASKNPEKIKAHTAKFREKHRESLRANQRRLHQELKLETIRRYGGVCQCCGISEPQFLTIDHMRGDGSEHRREIFGNNKFAGSRFYRWLKKENWPEGFQVLCFNCNVAKGKCGVCPHVATQ